MILRNKRAEDIFTLFLFILVVFFSTSLYLNYIFTSLLARLSIKWTFISIVFSLLYNASTRSIFISSLNFFRQIEGLYLGTAITMILWTISTFINVGLWRLLGFFIFRKIRKRISTDVVS